MHTLIKTFFMVFAMFSIMFFLYDNQNLNKVNEKSIEIPVNKKSSKDARVFKMKKIEKRIGERNLADTKSIQAANIHKLPGRERPNISAKRMCKNDKKNFFCMPALKNFQAEYRTASRYNLSTCVTHKSMSTVMTAIFCFLHNEDKFIKNNRNIFTEWKLNRFCMGRNEHFSFRAMKRKSKISGNWTYTMVVRDPIDRFISGFVDKCIRKSPNEVPCFGCGSNLTCFVINEYNRMRDQVKNDHFWGSFEDRHFFPQNWRCDLYQHYKEYKFIRYSSDPAGNLMKDLVPILKQSNVPQKSIDYIKNALTSGRTDHSTIKSTARSIIENRLRSSPLLMEYVVRMFYHDFELFGFPLPDGF